jgi:hypothetical protein
MKLADIQRVEVEVPMKKLLTAAVALIFVLGAAPLFATPVSLELVLLVDVSGSIDSGEFALQQSGYASAFNTNVANAFGTATPPAPFAVTLIYWSGANQQQVGVDWTLIDDAASAMAFGAAVAGTSRPFNGLTAPADAIQYARMYSFAGNGYEGDRLVIDVSGDGQRNDGGNDTFGQATAAHNSQGITINGLVILGEAGVQTWYQDNIVTPGGGFLMVANDFGDFGDAIADKISYEVSPPIPEPGTLTLLGSALLGLAGLRRKKA